MNNNAQNICLPMLSLRGLNAFPGMLLTFEIERPMSLAALNYAMGADRIIFLLTQKEISIDIPQKDDLYEIGTVCRIRQQLKQPGGNTARVMVEGLYRAKLKDILADNPNFYVQIERLEDKKESITKAKKEALLRNSINLLEEYVRYSDGVAHEALYNILSKDDLSYVADYVANTLHFKYQDKQKILEELKPSKRLTLVSKLLHEEICILTIEQELNDATNIQLNKNQKEYYLHEQLKIIQKELGNDVEQIDDIQEYRQKIYALNIKDREIEDKLIKDISNLSKQQFGSAEASVIRNYLDTVISLPWNSSTKENINIENVRKILNRDHYGLEDVKERILEYMAVKQLSPNSKGGVICLVGPPGTGKTSIAISIASAINRKLVRLSLGGVHDEAEIRGHRKTYVGAMPGRIINAVIKSKSKNPLIVMDEIDKLGSDYRGDPASALLEVLDSEQNSTFRDNYLEIPWDLSDVFFIMTANSLDSIPRPLLDRMEIITLSSYTDEEKVHIAKDHLISKARKEHGLNGSQVKFNDSIIRRIIASYTKESGVRNLQRLISAICRKAALGIAEGKYKTLYVNSKNLESLLGPAKFKSDNKIKDNLIGVVNGLAWTQVGGEVLEVEVAVIDGSGKVEITGNLGQVMKESTTTALTAVKLYSKVFDINQDIFKTKDIHIHFPDGATPKDGPSAGITIATAIVSALTSTPVFSDIAMTGEITITGRVLPIGGLKEKTMAAYRNNIKTVIIPEDNISNLEEIDKDVKKNLNFITVNNITQVTDTALLKCSNKNHISKSSISNDDESTMRMGQ